MPINDSPAALACKNLNFSITQTPGKPVTITLPAMSDIEAARMWLTEQRPVLRAALFEHGHVYLRGLPVFKIADFAVVRDALVGERAEYKEKATPRSDYGNDIYSSTDLPPMQAIRPHNENSYTLDFPGVLAFCCLEAPVSGGATIIADVRKVLSNIPAPLADRFRMHGWRLARNYSREVGLPWRSAFATDDRSSVVAYCQRSLISAQWLGADGLRTVQRRPAIIRHPVTKEEVWFNHVAFWNSASLDKDVREVLLDAYGVDGLPFETTLGNGEKLSADEVQQINEAYDSAICREAWRPGDVLLIDNILCAHGRDAFVGRRRVLVAMGEPVALADCHPYPTPSSD
ncbi:TauD/TfdA family dioxygenase [Paraburkholderia metrosideri]|uniref:TauD/TfdA family dioxygenase n=1 Tax=Paraburkholderia metrosideri TaxID=580937 RepID=A0ABW9DWY5_9BURK